MTYRRQQGERRKRAHRGPLPQVLGKGHPHAEEEDMPRSKSQLKRLYVQAAMEELTDEEFGIIDDFINDAKGG